VSRDRQSARMAQGSPDCGIGANRPVRARESPTDPQHVVVEPAGNHNRLRCWLARKDSNLQFPDPESDGRYRRAPLRATPTDSSAVRSPKVSAPPGLQTPRGPAHRLTPRSPRALPIGQRCGAGASAMWRCVRVRLPADDRNTGRADCRVRPNRRSTPVAETSRVVRQVPRSGLVGGQGR
jgi:hypothetical protein